MKYIALHDDKRCETISYCFSLFEMDCPITAYSFELMHIKVYGLIIELVPCIIHSELQEVNAHFRKKRTFPKTQQKGSVDLKKLPNEL